MKEYTQKISNVKTDEERALYGTVGAEVEDCTFEGPADGESALKEVRGVNVRRCSFQLRYPLWHAKDFVLANSKMGDTCRAPLWYAADGEIIDTVCTGVKALRECDRVTLRGCDFVSTEFGWRCRDISAVDSKFTSEYFFFESKNLSFKDCTLTGKYSYQYVENLTIRDCNLDTKDSFWHAKNVLVENSTVKGEYLGWYSEGLTMRNCRIIGTQPFCYCKNLRLEDCELIDCDLAFEYSEVQADLRGHVISIKNPLSGRIVVDSVGEIIRTGSIYPCTGEVVVR